MKQSTIAGAVLFTESSPNLGGQELQLLSQMRALRAAGAEVVLACRPGSRIEMHAIGMGLPVRTFPFRNSFDIPTIWGLRALIRALRPVACICHSGHDTNNLSIAARLSHAKRPRLLRSKTYLAGKISARTYNRFVDCTFAPSGYLRTCILANPQVDPREVHIVAPGVDFERLDAERNDALPAELSLWLERQDGPIIMQVGMLREEKGHLLMLDALAKLRRAGYRFRFVIAGAGPERQAIEARAASLGLEERIWIGALTPIAPALSKADLVVMPSLVEPLGMAQIEAAGLGIPVVATNVGGIPETIIDRQTGLLCSPDPDDLARAVEYALTHPAEMREMADRAQADVRHRFCVARNLEALMALIVSTSHRTRSSLAPRARARRAD
jgi:glycosyltransferase involved in cell wall biosynthesis